MEKLQCKTRGDEKPKGKPRVYFTCHPADFEGCFPRLCKDLFQSHDCAVYYTQDLNQALDENTRTLLQEFNLVVVPVTRRLLTEPSRAMDADLPLALTACVPVLPVLMERDLDVLYAQPDKFGTLQYLDAGSTDVTQITYADKLKKYLDSVFLSREMTDRIKAAFSARVFLSYRKKDRQYANRLMRMIHSHPDCRDFAIWFDEFLIPGKSFSDSITQVLADSDLFTLLVTPSILEEPDGEPNFVMREEYPSARRSGIQILPVQMQKTDRNSLLEKFEALPECLDPYQKGTFAQKLSQAIAKLVLRTGDNSPMHRFLIGLAYLDGIDMEVDRQRALALITEAAGEQLPEAMEKLMLMYTNGDGVPQDPEQAAFWSRELAEYFFRQHITLSDPEALAQLFSNYRNSYWAEVIRQFLLLTDARLERTQAAELWKKIIGLKVREYTLLFSATGAMEHHRELAQGLLLADILKKSTDGTYPPYGPLFWYVPEFSLYEALLCSLESLPEHPDFSKMLALCRDVCWIFGHYHTARQVTEKIDPAVLFAKARLTGVRQTLCRLFFLEEADTQVGGDVYPRCFNIREAKAFMDTGSGIWDKLSTPFKDELDLFRHEMYPLLEGEWIGIVAAPYDQTALETTLAQADSSKLRGLILSPTEEDSMGYIAFNRAHTEVFYIPENITDLWYRNRWRDHMPLRQDVVRLSGKLFYFRSEATIPPGPKSIRMDECSGVQSLTAVTVPEGVIKLDLNAFEACRSLQTVRLPNSLQKLDDQAFVSCFRLQTVHFGSGLEEIGSNAFGDCFALESVTLPDSVKVIKNAAFRSCEKLKTVVFGEAVEEIYPFAFWDCTALEVLTLPAGIQKLGEKTFCGCTAVKLLRGCPSGYSAAYLGIPETAQIYFREAALQALTFTQAVPKNACAGNHDLGSVRIAPGVESLGEGAFARCAVLTAVELPESLTDIGSQCFHNCVALQKIRLPDSLPVIAYSLFNSCTALTDVKLPEHLLEIQENAFRCCSSLEEVIFPPELQTIGRKAFAGCSGLRRVVFPDSLQSIAELAFENCGQMEELVNCPTGYPPEYLGLKESVQVRYRRSAPPQPLEISEEEIAPQQYAHRGDISRVDFPQKLTRIGDGGFLCCTALSGFSLPEGLTHIGKDAFRFCGKLTEAVLPDTVTQLGEASFDGCTRLEQICLSAGMRYIPENCFRDCVSLRKVTVPEGVTSIWRHAFLRCSALAEIHLPQGLESIDDAFNGCTALEKVNIPDSVTALYGTFRNCTGLREAHLPESLEQFGRWVFADCTALERLIIPQGVEIIEAYTCQNCIALTQLQIPDSVTRIERRAFENCSALETLYIPESVRDVADNAFAGCTGLQVLTLPAWYKDSLERFFPGVDLSRVELHWL